MSLLINSFTNYFIFRILIVCAIILCVLLMINKKYQKYIISIISLILIILIVYYYHKTLIGKEAFKYIMHNIRFYFLNSIIFLVTISISSWFMIKKRIINIIYCLSFIFLSFSLFMTHYVHNIELITVGNIYPMIVYGNYLYLIFYVYLIILLIKKKVFDKQ